jgi:hypothetical protein
LKDATIHDMTAAAEPFKEENSNARLQAVRNTADQTALPGLSVTQLYLLQDINFGPTLLVLKE